MKREAAACCAKIWGWFCCGSNNKPKARRRCKKKKVSSTPSLPKSSYETVSDVCDSKGVMQEETEQGHQQELAALEEALSDTQETLQESNSEGEIEGGNRHLLAALKALLRTNIRLRTSIAEVDLAIQRMETEYPEELDGTVAPQFQGIALGIIELLNFDKDECARLLWAEEEGKVQFSECQSNFEEWGNALRMKAIVLRMVKRRPFGAGRANYVLKQEVGCLYSATWKRSHLLFARLGKRKFFLLK